MNEPYELIGVGVDCEEIDRFHDLVNDDSFLNKVLSINERKMFKKKICDRDHFLAGRFVAKESIIKSLSGLASDIPMERMCIAREKERALDVSINHPLFDDDRIRINLSISHCNKLAIAFCVAERRMAI